MGSEPDTDLMFYIWMYPPDIPFHNGHMNTIMKLSKQVNNTLKNPPTEMFSFFQDQKMLDVFWRYIFHISIRYGKEFIKKIIKKRYTIYLYSDGIKIPLHEIKNVSILTPYEVLDVYSNNNTCLKNNSFALLCQPMKEGSIVSPEFFQLITNLIESYDIYVDALIH